MYNAYYPCEWDEITSLRVLQADDPGTQHHQRAGLGSLRLVPHKVNPSPSVAQFTAIVSANGPYGLRRGTIQTPNVSQTGTLEVALATVYKGDGCEFPPDRWPAHEIVEPDGAVRFILKDGTEIHRISPPPVVYDLDTGEPCGRLGPHGTMLPLFQPTAGVEAVAPNNEAEVVALRSH